MKFIFVGQTIRNAMQNYSPYLNYSLQLRRWTIRHFCPTEVPTVSSSVGSKDTLMQIWKSAKIFVFIWK